MGSENNLKMRDCVLTAAVLLQLESVVSALDESAEQGADAETAREIALLTRCGNLVLHEIASEYIPLRVSERVTVRNKRFDYSALSRKAVDIYSVKRAGKSVPFRQFYDSFTVGSDGDYTVEYSFEPLRLDLGGVSEFAGNKPSARTVAYGIACEYCLISGMSDEAVLWDKRYKDSLAVRAGAKNERKVAARVWR